MGYSCYPGTAVGPTRLQGGSTKLGNSFPPEIVISLMYKKHLVVATTASPFPTQFLLALAARTSALCHTAIRAPLLLCTTRESMMERWRLHAYLSKTMNSY